MIGTPHEQRFPAPHYLCVLVGYLVSEALYLASEDSFDDVTDALTFSGELTLHGGPLTIRSYDWEEDWGEDRDQRWPNLEFAGVRFWWYKYPVRSLEVNQERSPEEWIAWWNEAYQVVEKVVRGQHVVESGASSA